MQHIVEGFFRLCVVVFQNADVEQAQTIVEIGAALLLHIRNAFCAPPQPGIVQLLNGPGEGFIELLIAVTHNRRGRNKNQGQKAFSTGKSLLGDGLKVGLGFAGEQAGKGNILSIAVAQSTLVPVEKQILKNIIQNKVRGDGALDAAAWGRGVEQPLLILQEGEAYDSTDLFLGEAQKPVALLTDAIIPFLGHIQ